MFLFGADDTINLSKGWSDFWTGLKGASGGIENLLNLLTVFGALIIVAAIAKMLWEKARGSGGGGMGGGGGKNGLMWAIVFGAILAGPNLLLPAMLALIDALVNGIASVATNVSGSK